MDDIDRPLEPLHRVEQRDNVRIILDETRKLEDRVPMTIRIIVRPEVEAPSEPPALPAVRIIHEEELERMMDIHNARITEEDEPMTFGEAVTLLIAIGVLLYLIYALLWPERF